MTDEEIEQKNKEAEETANQNGSADETNEELENQADGSADQSGSADETNADETVDFEAELAAERERREKAEKKIVELKRQSKEGGKEVDIEALVEEKVNAKLQDSASDMLENSLANIPDAKERELVAYHYKNSIRHTGYTPLAIQKDVARSRLLANEKSLLRENSEMKLALKAKHSVGRGAGSNQDREIEDEDLGLSAEDKAYMAKRGLTIEQVKATIARNK